MTRNLSISHAWEETKSRIAADGRLFVTVALALLALPSAIGQFATAGTGMTRTPQSVGEAVLMIIVWLIGLVGQLALIRLAIGPSISVGEAIAHGGRRAPAYVGAVILILIGIMLVSIPFVLALAALGATFEPGAAPPPSAYLFMLLFIALLLFIAIRMMLASAVASAEQKGPIGIVKRSWELTGGHALRLFGFLLLFVIAVVVTVGAVSIATNLVIAFFFGPPEPMTVGTLIIALVESIASAVATTLFIVMLARIYVQLTGGASVEASVPRSGT